MSNRGVNGGVPHGGATPSANPILLYDGACGLCSGLIRFALRHERSQSLRFATLQGSVGRQILQRYPQFREIDSAVLFEPATQERPERVHVRSNAVLRVAIHLGGVWRLMAFGYVVPRPVRDAVYDLIARHRHRLPRSAKRCRVADAATAHRFLDRAP